MRTTCSSTYDRNRFLDWNNALASSEHMRPPTCDVPAHCSRLLLQTTRGRLHIKLFLYSRRKRCLDENSAHNEGHDCSWEKKKKHIWSEFRDTACVTSWRKAIKLLTVGLWLTRWKEAQRLMPHRSFCDNYKSNAPQAGAAAAASCRRGTSSRQMNGANVTCTAVILSLAGTWINAPRRHSGTSPPW